MPVVPKVVPVNVVIFAEVPVSVVMFADTPVSVVMLAEALLKLLMLAEVETNCVMVPLSIRPTVADRSVITAEVAAKRVTVADVNVKLSMVALVAVRFVIVALSERKTVIEPSPATVRLLGLVPISMTELDELMEKSRLSAVLTANSAPPAALVRFAVAGTAPGVSLFLVKIVVITMFLCSGRPQFNQLMGHQVAQTAA